MPGRLQAVETVFAMTVHKSQGSEFTHTALLLPENKEVLTQILTYHVVAGEVMSTDIEPGDVPTVEGEDLTIKVTDGTVTVNGATVEAADVEASNGVIHVIDEVLVPPNVDVASLTS